MANMDVTILPGDYDDLKKEYLILRRELDVLKQELYDKQRDVKRFAALNLEYQTEIEILQSEEIKRKEKLQEQIRHYEETVNVLRSRHNERLQELELEISRKDETITTLQSEVDVLKCKNICVTKKEDPNKLIEEIHVLRDENICYINDIEEMKQSLENLHGKNLLLENNLKELTEELINLKECLSCKREELDEANNIIQKTNDQILEIKSELDSCRSQPLDNESKGNSLFAEVDDRRVYLQNTVSNMKSEYIAMKQERSKNISMIRHLKLENQRLIQRWESEIKEIEEDEDTVIKAYKGKIRVLEELIEGYKKDLESKIQMSKIEGYEAYCYCELMLKCKTDEINDLRNKLCLASTTERLLSIALREANAQKRHWRIEATLKENLLNLRSEGCSSEVDIANLRQAIENKVHIVNNLFSPRKDSINHQLCESDKIIHEKYDRILETGDNIEIVNKNVFQIPETSEIKNLSLEVVSIDDSTDSGEVLVVPDNQTESFTTIKSEKLFKRPMKVLDEIKHVAEDIIENPILKVEKSMESGNGIDENIVKTEEMLYEQHGTFEDKDNSPTETIKTTSELVKKVTFTENTVSPIVRIPSKLRGKITILKPVLFD